MSWLARARAKFSQESQEHTDETDKSGVSSVLSVHSSPDCEKLKNAASDEKPELADWRALALAYQQHSYKCPQCVAAGLGYGSRCDTGLLLWVRYGEAWELGEGFS